MVCSWDLNECIHDVERGFETARVAWRVREAAS